MQEEQDAKGMGTQRSQHEINGEGASQHVLCSVVSAVLLCMVLPHDKLKLTQSSLLLSDRRGKYCRFVFIYCLIKVFTWAIIMEQLMTCKAEVSFTTG